MNKIFHRGYFKEMFRQLRVAGIVSACVLMLNNLVSVIKVLIGLTSFQSLPNGLSLSAPFLGYIYVMGLVLTFIGFGWMNRRGSSDFYHGIPIKRIQMYFSTIAAILLWMFIGITAYAIVHALIYLLTGSPFNYLLYFFIYINMLIGALEVVGAVAIACCVSGTRFVNFFASLVILFMPRLLLTVLGYFTAMNNHTLLPATISPLFNTNFNLIAAPYGVLLGETLGNSLKFDSFWTILYSFVYSMILVILGCVAFRKRRSETAGVPSGKGFQFIVRTAIGLPMLLILDFILILSSGENGFLRSIEFSSGIIISAVVFILLAFVFYSLYELISTKSGKKMLKAMPLFTICLAIGAAFLIIPAIISKVENSIRIKEENIKGYSILMKDQSIYEVVLGNDDYAAAVTDGIRLTDPEGIAKTAKAYEYTRNTGNGYITVRIDRKLGRSITRKLFYVGSNEEDIYNAYYHDPRYIEASSNFPDGRNYYFIEGLTKKEAAEIGKLFISEFNQLSYDKKLKCRASYSGDALLGILDPYNVRNADLLVCGCKGTKNYSQGYIISDYTPKTAARYYEIVNRKNAEKCKELISNFNEWIKNGSEYGNYTINISGSVNIVIDSWDLMYGKNDEPSFPPYKNNPEVAELIEILSHAVPASDTQNGLRIDGNYEKSGRYYYNCGPAMFELSSADLARINEIVQLIQYGEVIFD